MILLGMLIVTAVRADDPGILKSRLFELNDSTYILEVDVSKVMIGAIRTPVFPEGFEVAKPEYIRNGQWLVVKYDVTSNRPLKAEDVIQLPWLRNGVDLTVQWSDGTISERLYLREVDGIRVPVSTLIPTQVSLVQTMLKQFRTGIGHYPFGFVHILLVIVLAAGLSSGGFLKAMGAFALGQAMAMIPADLNLHFAGVFYGDIMIGIVAIIASLQLVKQQEIKGLAIMIAGAGFVHSLGYAQEIALISPGQYMEIPSLFAFNLGVDICNLIAGGATILLLGIIRNKQLPRIIGSITGILAVAAITWLYVDVVAAGHLHINEQEVANQTAATPLPTSETSQGQQQAAQGAEEMTTPVMTYVSIEPYEVRQEVLVSGSAALHLLDLQSPTDAVFPVGEQQKLRDALLEVINSGSVLKVDQQKLASVSARADFVTLSQAGVIIREMAIPEPVQTAIIGVTLVYETEELADQLEVEWNVFSDEVAEIELSIIDPFGVSVSSLSRDGRNVSWESRLRGFQVPAIEDLKVERPQLPLVPALLLLLAATGAMLTRTRPRTKPITTSIYILTIAGFCAYPFLRTDSLSGAIASWKPSTERTEEIMKGLLTNVYRAFDVRSEEKVYDRLAISVTGDQLADIYLQNRRSLELAERGGLRANVDDVNIIEVSGVNRTGKDQYTTDVQWLVSGSVNHFGHTHYRRNFNLALITFSIVDDTWKIQDIEIIEEERLMYGG